MIKGHDSREEEEEEESAVLGACNLVSLFFLETGGRAAGRSGDRRPRRCRATLEFFAK